MFSSRTRLKLCNAPDNTGCSAPLATRKTRRKTCKGSKVRDECVGGCRERVRGRRKLVPCLPQGSEQPLAFLGIDKRDETQQRAQDPPGPLSVYVGPNKKGPHIGPFRWPVLYRPCVSPRLEHRTRRRFCPARTSINLETISLWKYCLVHIPFKSAVWEEAILNLTSMCLKSLNTQ